MFLDLAQREIRHALYEWMLERVHDLRYLPDQEAFMLNEILLFHVPYPMLVAESYQVNIIHIAEAANNLDLLSFSLDRWQPKNACAALMGFMLKNQIKNWAIAASLFDTYEYLYQICGIRGCSI